jgi:glycerol kinase
VNRLRESTGLPLASYFAGTKVKWLLDNVDSLQADLGDPEKRKQVRFGTVDTWLVYQLTGTKSKSEGAANAGGLFVTDVSNASRWLFLNINTMAWDQKLIDIICAPHSVPIEALPKIMPSSKVYATYTSAAGVPILDQVPIASILGDQHAALVGQCAFNQGEAKNTYGTGLFLMMNTGPNSIPSSHGLLTTVAYQLGEDQPIMYALEGSVSHSGSTIQWLRDQLGIITKASESEKLAETTNHNDGLYFVPAFAGLFAPYWRSDARACIVGMTASHHKGHICRAALEAAAYQTREVFDAMYADSGVQLKALKVDGGGTANKLMMQFQADIINVDVVRPVVMETTARGAAFAAGLAVGVWKDLDELCSLWKVAETFKATMKEEKRYDLWMGWKKAVSKSMGWVEVETIYTNDEETDDGYATAEEDEKEVIDTVITPRTGFDGTTLVLLTVCAFTAGFLTGRSRK